MYGLWMLIVLVCLEPRPGDAGRSGRTRRGISAL